MTPKGTKESCQCDKCKAACLRKPGWFLPGEAEKVAKHLKISLEELFKTKLAIDWWKTSPSIFVLSPAVISGTTGDEFPANPNGACIFFKDGLCEIHPVKPYECQIMNHDIPAGDDHKLIAEAWKAHQSQIEDLLGRKPISKGWSIFDHLFEEVTPW